MLQNKGYTKAVDFWAIGCILYELIAGYPPFAAETPNEVLANILHWETTLEYPQYDDDELPPPPPGEEEYDPDSDKMSTLAWDLIKKLICSPEERLTFEQIIAHPFFADIDWTNLRSSEPPFVPELENPADTSYFDKSYFEAENLDSLVSNVKDSGKVGEHTRFDMDAMSTEFAGFTFKRFSPEDLEALRKQFAASDQKNFTLKARSLFDK